jgi:hypothetical protein
MPKWYGLQGLIIIMLNLLLLRDNWCAAVLIAARRRIEMHSHPPSQLRAGLQSLGLQAGTFEERAVTDWAKQQLQQTLVGTSSSKAVVTSCNVVSGDAHIWFIRGKKRHGFEFDIELQWKLGSSSSSSAGDDAAAAADADAAAGSSGNIKLSGVSPDELDDLSHMEVTLSNASGDAAADSAALAAAKGLKEPLEQALAAFYAELRTR